MKKSFKPWLVAHFFALITSLALSVLGTTGLAVIQNRHENLPETRNENIDQLVEKLQKTENKNALKSLILAEKKEAHAIKAMNKKAIEIGIYVTLLIFIATITSIKSIAMSSTANPE